MRRLVLAVLVACVALGSLAQESLAGTRSPVPRMTGLPVGPCGEDNVMDIEIIDGVWFECGCEHLPFGKPVCDWYEITSPAHDPTKLRRWIKLNPRFHVHVVSWARMGAV